MMSLKLEPLVLALILFSWMSYARIINSNIVKLKQSEYAMAATTLGVGHSRIVFRHLLPNAIAPAIVLVARDIGSMVVLEAAFTFIGLSSGLPWGVILVTGRDWIIGTGGSPLTYWWTFLPVTLTLILFGIGWNLLGDGLNDVMDPRSLAHKVN
jgi:peptide/nickel transport system permease protein